MLNEATGAELRHDRYPSITSKSGISLSHATPLVSTLVDHTMLIKWLKGNNCLTLKSFSKVSLIRSPSGPTYIYQYNNKSVFLVRPIQLELTVVDSNGWS